MEIEKPEQLQDLMSEDRIIVVRTLNFRYGYPEEDEEDWSRHTLHDQDDVESFIQIKCHADEEDPRPVKFEAEVFELETEAELPEGWQQ